LVWCILTSNLVHNDFHQTHGLFPLFEGLEVADLDKEIDFSYSNGTPETNGTNGVHIVNGTNGTNGANDTKPPSSEKTPLVNGSS
jgi:methylenetetrahydrofolate reductase (NADPH)